MAEEDDRLALVLAYIGDARAPEDIAAAFEAEAAAQARVCREPRPGENTADLDEALCRRVAVNLALRPLTLGFQPLLSEATASAARVGGGDREVDRLERPWRRLVVG